MICRNLLGEDLAQMNTRELVQLESQLEVALKNIRSTKVTSTSTYICELLYIISVIFSSQMITLTELISRFLLICWKSLIFFFLMFLRLNSCLTSLPIFRTGFASFSFSSFFPCFTVFEALIFYSKSGTLILYRKKCLMKPIKP